MRRWVIWTVVIIACLGIFSRFALVLLERSACRAATENGTIKIFHQFTAEQLDRDVRNRVPLGSSRPFVENFLRQDGMRFSYDPSLNAILANAPCIKGSGIVLISHGAPTGHSFLNASFCI